MEVLSALPTSLESAGVFPPMRLAEPFERLRDRSDHDLARSGARPRVFLATLGGVVAASPRVGFARALFEAGGFETMESGELADSQAAAEALKASGASLACLCGPDAAYEENAAAFAKALGEAGARRCGSQGALAPMKLRCARLALRDLFSPDATQSLR